MAPVFARFEDRDRLTRQGALLALERARSAEAERRILAHLVATPDERDRFYCVAVLMSIGTEAALPALQRALRSGRKDVRFAANEAIALIAERSSKASL